MFLLVCVSRTLMGRVPFGLIIRLIQAEGGRPVFLPLILWMSSKDKEQIAARVF